MKDAAYIALVVNWVSFAAALISGICWIYAARIGAPIPVTGLGGRPLIEARPTRDFHKQSKWNGVAAWFAAIAAFCQGAGLFIANCLH